MADEPNCHITEGNIAAYAILGIESKSPAKL